MQVRGQPLKPHLQQQDLCGKKGPVSSGTGRQESQGLLGHCPHLKCRIKCLNSSQLVSSFSFSSTANAQIFNPIQGLLGPPSGGLLSPAPKSCSWTCAQLPTKISHFPWPFALALGLHLCAQLAPPPLWARLWTLPLPPSSSSVHKAPWKCSAGSYLGPLCYPCFPSGRLESGEPVTPGKASTTPHHLLPSQKPVKRYGAQQSQILCTGVLVIINTHFPLAFAHTAPYLEQSPPTSSLVYLDLLPSFGNLLPTHLFLRSLPEYQRALSAELLECLQQVDPLSPCMPDLLSPG